MTNSPIIFEACCGSAEDAINAFRGGALRVELNSDLFHGGLTPSIGTLLTVKAETPELKVMCMVRPREGGFCYTDTEFSVMLSDAEALIRAGADGIVFGILHEDGTIDEARCKRMLDLIGGRVETVCHRAFDLTPDPYEALETLIRLGFDRLLTSGQKPTVPEGVTLIHKLILQAAGRIEIMPGAGITPENAPFCKEKTGAACLHAALHRIAYDRSASGNPAIYFGGAVYPPEDRFLLMNPGDIQGFVSIIKGEH